MNAIRRINSNIPMLKEDLFSSFEQQFDRFFNDFFAAPVIASVKSNTFYPKMDVVVDKDNWKVKVAVPGVKKEDLTVEIEDRVLSIKGKMSEEYQNSEDDHHYVKELRKSAFTRQINIPDYLEGDPDTSLSDGILILSWPLPAAKVIEQEKARKIEIKG